MRSALVVSQIALAVVLVTVSGLMTRSLLRLQDVRPGFEADHVVTSRVLLSYTKYGTGGARLNFFQAMAREARAIPGARDVALTDWVPLSGDRHDTAIHVEGDLSRAARVDGPYFQVLRIPLLRGRTFGVQDVARPMDEAIVSHAFAERYWPGASPLGQRARHLPVAARVALWRESGGSGDAERDPRGPPGRRVPRELAARAPRGRCRSSRVPAVAVRHRAAPCSFSLGLFGSPPV